MGYMVSWRKVTRSLLQKAIMLSKFYFLRETAEMPCRFNGKGLALPTRTYLRQFYSGNNDHLPLKFGFLFSRNAEAPSFASSVAKHSPNFFISRSYPCCVWSKLFTHSINFETATGALLC